MRDTLARFLADGTSVRGLAADVTSAAEETRRAHGLGPDATRFAAHGLVAGALMSAYLKGDQRVTVQVQGEDPRLAFMADVWADGDLRARLTPPDLRSREGGAVDGVLLAIKIDAGVEVYRGVTAIDGTRIEHALATHLARSSQVDTVIRLGVHLDETGAVTSACGILVERMPLHADLPSLEPAEFHARYAGVASADAAAVLESLEAGSLVGREAEVTDTREVRWRCRCSRERVEGMLLALGVEDLRGLRVEQGEAEVTCHFCNTRYEVPADRLDELLVVLETDGSA